MIYIAVVSSLISFLLMFILNLFLLDKCHCVCVCVYINKYEVKKKDSKALEMLASLLHVSRPILLPNGKLS